MPEYRPHGQDARATVESIPEPDSQPAPDLGVGPQVVLQAVGVEDHAVEAPVAISRADVKQPRQRVAEGHPDVVMLESPFAAVGDDGGQDEESIGAGADDGGRSGAGFDRFEQDGGGGAGSAGKGQGQHPAGGYLAVQATLLLPAFILAEATLSYVGLGFPDTVPTWGTMLQEGSSVRAFADFPWLLSPAAAMFLVVLGLNLLFQQPGVGAPGTPAIPGLDDQDEASVRRHRLPGVGGKRYEVPPLVVLLGRRNVARAGDQRCASVPGASTREDAGAHQHDHWPPHAASSRFTEGGHHALRTGGVVDSVSPQRADSASRGRRHQSSATNQTSFVKIKVTLELPSEKDAQIAQEKLPVLQDHFNTYLRDLRATDLSGSAGMYRLREGAPGEVRAQLLGSGAILGETLAAADLLQQDFGVAADVWSVTSYSELRRDGQETERWNRLHPLDAARQGFVETRLADTSGPVIAATDYMKVYADQIRAYLPQPAQYVVLGTDGMGRDIAARLLFGARVSMVVGCCAPASMACRTRSFSSCVRSLS